MNTGKVLAWSMVVALGGFLFGFDTAVISGAERSIQDLWGLNVFQHGLTVSIALIGTVFGALFGAIPSDAIGRKKTLFFIAVLYLVSAVGSALAHDWYALLLFRLVGGLGVGASSVTGPMYISEISPASHRGRMVMMFQFNVVLGILVAFCSNFLLEGAGNNAWRWMLGIQAIPATIFMVLILFIPESPRWLVFKKGAIEEAEKILTAINPTTARSEIRAIELAHAKNQDQGHHRLFSDSHRIPVMLSIFFAFFNQVSGINAIIYYAPRIFEMTGLATHFAFLSSAGIGLVNFFFTLLAINYIDRFGRRTLMLVGSVGLIVTLALVSRSFYVQDFEGYVVPICLFLYMAFFAFSQGAVCWVFISEIFPSEVRAKGQALGSFTHWLMAAVIAFSFPYITEKIGGGNSFMIFSAMMVLQLVFVLAMMPETKGKSLEELQTVLGH